MSDAEMRELRGVCEAFRSGLRSKMRISPFRLDVLCLGSAQHSILLVERGQGERRVARRGPPAVMTTPVRDAARSPPLSPSSSGCTW